MRDGFAINYGAGGMGTLLLANRKGIGPAASADVVVPGPTTASALLAVMRRATSRAPSSVLRSSCTLSTMGGPSCVAFGDAFVQANTDYGNIIDPVKIVRNTTDLIAQLHKARTEALAGFGRADVYLERYVEAPRHIEVQVIADEHGNAAAIGFPVTLAHP